MCIVCLHVCVCVCVYITNMYLVCDLLQFWWPLLRVIIIVIETDIRIAFLLNVLEIPLICTAAHFVLKLKNNSCLGE